MSGIGSPERLTQNRVIKLFCGELGYTYLGNWEDRGGNRNIEEGLLVAYLKKSGVGDGQISRVLDKLQIEAQNPHRSLYENNKIVYSLLRFGVEVKVAAGDHYETISLVNWKEPTQNDFGIAEEVTLDGNQQRRPDLVLYVNGIAIGVLELKNSRVSISDGIRQSLSNQQPEFNEDFFSTVQFVFAGNDSEGLRYGTIKTEEKYFLSWKEDEQDNSGYKLDKYLAKMCRKERLIELIYDFVLFDGGVKKLPRVHQYFGIKAAQQHVNSCRGGILWHTQGSGKSIVMVLLAKWILENKPRARVVIVTDRDELDKQIESVFTEAGESMARSKSGRELMSQLGLTRPRLLCSLIHKFGARGVDDFDAYIAELEQQPSITVGEVFVFVDECHRTQSGRLHRTMKALLPNAVFIGFTGTPLLKADKKTTMEVFGGYIHTYKYNEAVADHVVLDLEYEARDVKQELTSKDRVDAWFEAKTRGLNEWQKAALREQWGTMQRVLSSRSRMERVVSDIVFDFSVKPRLSNRRGNAMLVANNIHEACRYFELFQRTSFKGQCAVVTSYDPKTRDITLEDTGANTETDKEFIYRIYTDLLKDVDAHPGKSKTETYEDEAKRRFKEEPANMKLLIVVAKLLTGFDAPSCTYLYIDKEMRDHGLFQAICRTNRLDGDDKTVGYIVDYKDLVKNLVNEKGTGALQVYTAELDHAPGSSEPEIMMNQRLVKGKERLDNALEAIALLCEPVQLPRAELDYIHYFCGNVELAEDLKAHEPQRAALYKATVAFVRAYAHIADELEAAGYSKEDIVRIKGDLDRYLKLREVIRNASGETIDLKAYEADMRHLLDTYIQAEEPRKISPFNDLSLLELMEQTGMDAAIASLPEGIRKSKDAIAETIANNVRSKIIKDHLNDPAFYERMSVLLTGILNDLRAKRIEYEEYLKRIAQLAQHVITGKAEDTPAELETPGPRAVYSTLLAQSGSAAENLVTDPAGAYGDLKAEALRCALQIDAAVRRVRPDEWRDNISREQVIKRALFEILKDHNEVARIFPIIKKHRDDY